MLKQIIKIVKRVGKDLEQDFYLKNKVFEKSANNFYTETDIKIEKKIMKKLQKKFSNFNFIGEEKDNFNIKDINNTFIIDPIDGTTNFINKIPFFAISVSVFKKGKLYIGVVYNPITKELFYAQKNKGAFFINSDKNELNPPVNIGSVYINKRVKIDNNHKLILEKYNQELTYNRNFGSASLELCYLAKKSLNLVAYSAIKPWDILASILILTESGGSIYNLDLEVLDIENLKGFIAFNSNKI